MLQFLIISLQFINLPSISSISVTLNVVESEKNLKFSYNPIRMLKLLVRKNVPFAPIF